MYACEFNEQRNFFFLSVLFCLSSHSLLSIKLIARSRCHTRVKKNNNNKYSSLCRYIRRHLLFYFFDAYFVIKNKKFSTNGDYSADLHTTYKELAFFTHILYYNTNRSGSNYLDFLSTTETFIFFF